MAAEPAPEPGPDMPLPMHPSHILATVPPMKWLGVIVLLIVGILAALVAVEYLTVSIHAVPAFMGRHPGRGHYRKRGAAAVLVAVIAFVAAGYLIVRMRRADKAALAAAGPVGGAAAAGPNGPDAVAPAVPVAELPTESSVAPDQPVAPEQPSSEQPSAE